MQWNAKSFDVGEIIYLINVHESFEQQHTEEEEINELKCVGCIVKEIPKQNILIVEVCDNKMPSNYDVLVKLPYNLMRDCQRLLQLPKGTNLDDNIPKMVSDSLIGFTNPSGPGVALIETPLGTSGCFSAAKWLANTYKPGEKTLVIAPSSLVLDDFISVCPHRH